MQLIQNLSRDVRPRRHAVAALASLGGLALIVWAALVAWPHICWIRGPALRPGEVCLSSLAYFVPLLVAFGFWIIGVCLWLARGSVLVLAFHLLIAGALAIGRLTGLSLANNAAWYFFYALLAWIVPTILHFHVSLLDRPLRRRDQILLLGAYGLAILWSLLLLLSATGLPQTAQWFPTLRILVRLNLFVAWAAAWIWLYRSYSHGDSWKTRRNIRLITFGTFLGFAPMLFLALIPDTLQMPAYVDYEYTFPCLLLTPLTYAYSLFHWESTQAELRVHRTAVYYLLVILFLFIYLLAAAILSRSSIRWEGPGVLEHALLSLTLLFLFAPLRGILERLISWVLYGRKVTYAGVVGRFAETLALTSDRETLRHLLIDDLARAMHLPKSILFLKGQDQVFSCLGAQGFALEAAALYQLPADGQLADYLKSAGGLVTDEQARRAAVHLSLGPVERDLLALRQTALWLPLISGNVMQGLLLIGERQDEEPFTAEERRILATLSFQAGIAAHNVRLMEQVRADQKDLERAHQQLLIGREQEQRRLAHALHDGAVQQLLGISYQIYDGERRAAQLQPQTAAAPGEALHSPNMLRRSILGVVAQLRGLIGELRPAGLEELGLEAALEGYLARLKRECGLQPPEIELDVKQWNQATVPEAVSICLFRSAQEALRNAQKHAHAQKISVRLCQSEREVELRVQDDGCGFQVPNRLTELAQQDHFGLIGLAERVSWARGNLLIHSEPGAGTEIRVLLPLNGKEAQYG